MAEELQHLIDRIQKEGIDKAESEASRIVSKAKEQAAATINEAERKAKNIIEKAKQDAELYTQRSTATLEQASRDLLITVGQGIENIMSDIVAGAVEESLSIDTMKDIVVKIIEQQMAQEGKDGIEMLVAEKDREKLVKFISSRYKEQLGKGLELHADHEILKGFKVSISGGKVFLDFTDEAIAKSLSVFLRPQLAEIVTRAANAPKE